MNETSLLHQTSAETFCSICLDDFSPEPHHASFTLECGHAFGRSCIIKWQEKSLRCPVCRQGFFLQNEAPDDSFTNALKDQFNKFLHERVALACSLIYSGFFLATDLEELAYLNASVVAAHLVGALAVRCISEVSNNVRSVFFGRPGAENYLSLPKIVAEDVANCSLINAGWLCRKLLLGY